MDSFTTLTGTAAPLMRANVDTDTIIRIERMIGTTPEQMGSWAFEALRFRPDGSEDPDFVLNQAPFRAAPILLAGDNFGCGSSREYAMEALVGCGLAALVARSFARIFYRNAINLGLPVFETPFAGDLPDGAEATLYQDENRLVVDGRSYDMPPLPPFQRAIIAAGGLVPYIRAHGRFPGEPALEGLERLEGRAVSA